MTSGWQPSDLVIIAGRPAMGKTSFALSIAKNVAVDYDVPIGFFSLEMNNVQLVNRLISNVCEISKIAPNGQAFMHFPQYIHLLSSICSIPCSSLLIAFTGQDSSQGTGI